MSHRRRKGRYRGRASAELYAARLTLVFAICATVATVRAQEGPGTPTEASPPAAQPQPAAPTVVPPGTAPAVAVPPANVGTSSAPAIEPDVQVVRFQGPPGLAVEVLAPAPMPITSADGQGILTVGLKRGVGYRLRVTMISEHPGAELFPVIEVVGHLHRPDNINPAKYPIRVVFREEDLDDVVDHGRLVTKVVYLEDPDQAIPFRMAKDEVSALTLNPAESLLRVATALGRPMAIVRAGARQPSIDEINAGAAGDLGLEWAASIGNSPCPYLFQSGARCTMPCGPVCSAAPRPVQPCLPRDEYLCDGGDRGIPAAPSASGRVSGVEPRDAVIRFNIPLRGGEVSRVLPTNVVCVYAPRFAEVRTSTAAGTNVEVKSVHLEIMVEKEQLARSTAPPKRLVQHQAAELARNRARASALRGRVLLDEESNNRGAAAYENAAHIALAQQKQKPELARNRQKAALIKERARLIGIKTVEGPVVTGLVQSAGEAVKVWGPHLMTGVETPPNRPGLAVVKTVNSAEAEPGDTLTYVIMYRNMGNAPISSLVIVDSLLPRLEYVPGTSKGPEGTVFSTAVNKVGAVELRWELPGVLPPGVTGHVSFQTIVR